MDDHLIFYDGSCGFCHKSVARIYKWDTKRQFLYAPLQGETAKKYRLPQVDSIILLENFKSDKVKTTIKGKAIFRILALLHPSLYFLTYLPGWLVNPPYDLIAYLRQYLFPIPSCLVPNNLDKSRFLP